MLEKRKSKRYSLPLPAIIEYAINGDRQIEKAELINISLGGAFLKAGNSVDVGSTLNLNLHDPDSRPGKESGFPVTGEEALNIRIQGEIMRVDQPTRAHDNWRLAVKFNSPLRLWMTTKLKFRETLLSGRKA